MKLHKTFTVVLLLALTKASNGLRCTRPADVGFLVDGSGSVKNADFIKEKRFIASLINDFEIGRNSVNVGMTVYSSDIGDIVSLLPMKSKSLLIRLTSMLKKMDAGSNMALGIKRLRNMLTRQGTRSVPKYMIVFTDGRTSSSVFTISEAKLSRRENINIIVIGIGPLVMKEELKEVASSPDTLFYVNDFQSLRSIKDKILDILCPETLQKLVCTDSVFFYCQNDRIINIINTSYTLPNVLSCPRSNEYLCTIRNVKDHVVSRCNGRQLCLLREWQYFVEPSHRYCKVSYRHLQINYQCRAHSPISSITNMKT